MIEVRIPVVREDHAVTLLREHNMVIVLWMNQALRDHRAGEVWRDRAKARYGSLRIFDVTYQFHEDDRRLALLFKLMFAV